MSIIPWSLAPLSNVHAINGTSLVQAMKSVNKTFAELMESVWLLVLHRGAES